MIEKWLGQCFIKCLFDFGKKCSIFDRTVKIKKHAQLLNFSALDVVLKTDIFLRFFGTLKMRVNQMLKMNQKSENRHKFLILTV